MVRTVMSMRAVADRRPAGIVGRLSRPARSMRVQETVRWDIGIDPFDAM
ncbi:hypothetical protein [Methylobacterium sp. E-005]|nr:hypothetical protein [Methylobacterium sp. E-005]